MALSAKAIQKKREKKNQNRKNKAKQSTSPFSTPGITMACSTWPLYECWVSSGLWESGLGQVIVTRKNTQGHIAVGGYLIDPFFLGVKDCFSRITYELEYRSMLEHLRKSCAEIILVNSGYANSVIQESLVNAEQHLLNPHPNFKKDQIILKDMGINAQPVLVVDNTGLFGYVLISYHIL